MTGSGWDQVWPFLDDMRVSYSRKRWMRALEGIDPLVVGRIVADWNPDEHGGYPPRAIDVRALAGRPVDPDVLVVAEAFPDGDPWYRAELVGWMRASGLPLTVASVTRVVAEHPQWGPAVEAGERAA